MSDIEGIKEQAEIARLQLTTGNERLLAVDRHRRALMDAGAHIGELLVEITALINGPCKDALEGMAETVSEAESAYALGVTTVSNLSSGTQNIALQHSLDLASKARNAAGSGFDLWDGPHCATTVLAMTNATASAMDSLITATDHLQIVEGSTVLLGDGIEVARTDASEAILSLDAYIRYIAGPSASE